VPLENAFKKEIDKERKNNNSYSLFTGQYLAFDMFLTTHMNVSYVRVCFISGYMLVSEDKTWGDASVSITSFSSFILEQLLNYARM
jgi:hypothetical protein